MKALKYNPLLILLVLIFSVITFAQGPGEPLHPMTAPGATGISIYNHELVWENPTGTEFNEIYFSTDLSLVASLDSTVKIYDGYPGTVYSLAPLNIVGSLQYFTVYYWCIVEYSGTGQTAGPIWYFRSRMNPSYPEILIDDFSGGAQNWTITNDGGTCVWEVHNAAEYTLPPTATGNVLAADADFCGSGTTTLTTALYTGIDASNFYFDLQLEFDNDWNAIDPDDFAMVDVSTNGGTTWQNLLTFDVTDVRNTHEIWDLTSLVYNNSFDIRFVSIQPGWDWWWAVDNITISGSGPITPMHPPNYLYVTEDTSVQWVLVKWDPGFSPDPFTGYKIQRKEGLPNDASEYITIAEIDGDSLSYLDYEVQLNHNYTYRIQTMSGPVGSIWGNEATAYVPAQVPVELTSFTATVNSNDVHLNWVTNTEMNNLGFEVQRSLCNDQHPDWSDISFIPGNGTTSEVHYYSFTDESISSGKYQYRLKQIDYEGTFEYSDIKEVEVNSPLKFSLEQNYPNPFNPSTKIKFTIPTSPQSPPYQGGEAKQGWFVQLKVYDVLGNEIATLINEEKPVGTYEVEFESNGLTSGIYFYQLKAENYIDMKKMILLR